MPDIKKHKKVLRDNISGVNPNYLRKNLNITRSKCDDFRMRLIQILRTDICNIVLEYYDSKDINVLIKYIEINKVQEEYFKKAVTERLVKEFILQEKREDYNSIPKESIIYISRIMLHFMKIIAQEFQ